MLFRLHVAERALVAALCGGRRKTPRRNWWPTVELVARVIFMATLPLPRCLPAFTSLSFMSVGETTPPSSPQMSRQGHYRGHRRAVSDNAKYSHTNDLAQPPPSVHRSTSKSPTRSPVQSCRSTSPTVEKRSSLVHRRGALPFMFHRIINTPEERDLFARYLEEKGDARFFKFLREAEEYEKLSGVAGKVARARFIAQKYFGESKSPEHIPLDPSFTAELRETLEKLTHTSKSAFADFTSSALTNIFAKVREGVLDLLVRNYFPSFLLHFTGSIESDTSHPSGPAASSDPPTAGPSSMRRLPSRPPPPPPRSKPGVSTENLPAAFDGSVCSRIGAGPTATKSLSARAPASNGPQLSTVSTQATQSSSDAIVEQAEQQISEWLSSLFDALLVDDTDYRCFQRFLETHPTVTVDGRRAREALWQLRFCLEIEQFRKLPGEQGRRARALHMYRKYLKPGAECDLRLPISFIASLHGIAAIEKNPNTAECGPHLFDQVKVAVKEQLTSRHLVEFLLTREGRNLKKKAKIKSRSARAHWESLEKQHEL